MAIRAFFRRYVSVPPVYCTHAELAIVRYFSIKRSTYEVHFFREGEHNMCRNHPYDKSSISMMSIRKIKSALLYREGEWWKSFKRRYAE
jgi:hypothetical protein